MSTDFSIRPVTTPAPVQYVPVAAREAVKTDLPTEQTVQPAAAPTQVRLDAAALASVPDQISHQVTIDRAAGAIVYQSVDQRTSEVVTQYPDDAVLRRRAYFRTLDMMTADKQITNPVERKA